MDDKFLSYSNAGSKPESSNFDGTIQNLFTANFGGLTPVFCKPVLADDHFKISLNSEVKVSTLNAPAYSNIKQNFYAFFVANQQVWKHHNSFITNGTDFQGVYGNNMNNQQLNNAWKVPSIRVNDLQFITKVAKGFAIPVITLSATNEEVAIPFLYDMGFRLVEVNGVYVYQIKFPTSSVYQSFTAQSTGYQDLTPFAVNLLQIISPSFRSFLHYVPYVYFHDLQITNDVNSDVTIEFTSVDLGVSIDDLPFILSVLYKRNDVLTSSVVDTTDFNVNNNVQYIRYRLFCDESSHDVDINESPFKINYVRTDCLNGSISLNGVRYSRKYTQNAEFTSVSPQPLSGYSQDIKYVRLSNFWQKQLMINTNNSNSATQISINVADGTYFYIDSSSEYYEKWLELFESEDYYPESRFENQTIYCRQTAFYLVDYLESVAPLASNLNSSRSYSTNPDSSELQSQFILSAPSCDFIFPFYCNDLDSVNLTRASLTPYFTDEYGDKVNNPLQYIPRLDSTSIANNMTQSAFMYYLCNSVLKTLDYVGIPYEGFTIRDFDSYALEVISALPFMALSSIWNEYFRNRTVSAPELDFREVNYSGVVDNFVYAYMRNKQNDNGESEYFDLTDSTPQPHSWVIPFDVLPKNGLETVEFRDNLLQGLNEFHYFNVTCQSDLFSLLTGFQLNHCVLHQVLQPYTRVNHSDDYVVLYGALINRFVLPDYYNGLLHYKFQNFSKDYFSSALLDAMSGANQEEIPDTVTELRSSEARQSFWEQTAVARSVKKFFNKMFGTTPTHMDLCRPLLLGQSHNKISIGEIIQTSGTIEDSTPQGTRTGIGGGHSVNGICNHGFNEQGWLIILSSFTLDSQYFQGLNRQLIPYNSYLDYPFRNFYHIGNQSINMREISFISNPKYPNVLGRYSIKPFNFDSPDSPDCVSSFANNPQLYTKGSDDYSLSPNRCVDTDSKFSSVFGYIPRFSEYKFNFDELHGDFRNSLMSWNTFRKFHTIPFLTHNFVNWELSGQNYDLNRLFAVTDDSDKFICSLYINVQMHRQIPYYSIPKSSVN